MEYLEDLKKLIAGEAVCACQYKFACDNMKGDKNYSYLSDHFAEHFDEEWDHFSDLTQALLERDGSGFAGIMETAENALPKLVEIKSFDCEDLRKFFVDAEAAAVDAYQEFYDKIKEEDEDLADIIIGIIEDEKGHKLDFTRIADKVEKAETEEVEEETEEPEEEPFDMNAEKEPADDENKDTMKESIRGNTKQFLSNVEQLINRYVDDWESMEADIMNLTKNNDNPYGSISQAIREWITGGSLAVYYDDVKEDLAELYENTPEEKEKWSKLSDQKAWNRYLSVLSMYIPKAFKKHVGRPLGELPEEKESDDQRYWYGIPGIKMIWHGEWADPELEYNGMVVNYNDVEETMVSFAKDDGINTEDDDAFAEYIKDHADEVYDLIYDLYGNGGMSEGYNAFMKSKNRFFN